jgi:hypothetical protein
MAFAMVLFGVLLLLTLGATIFAPSLANKRSGVPSGVAHVTPEA